MTTPAVTVASGRPVAHAAELMLDLSIDRLPVVDSGRLVGILTRADLVRALVRDDAEIERDIREDGIVRTFWMPSDELTITVEQGDVRLEGRVDSEEVGESISAFARQVPGVVSVDSKLTWSNT
jgi:CBS domain-containing protein